MTDQVDQARDGVVVPPVAVPLTTEERIGGPLPTAAAARTSRERRRAIREWVILIGIALIVAIVVRQFVFQLFYIPSGSMIPDLKVGDQVFVNKLAYDFGNPQRGDVVVFSRPADWRDVQVDDLVKRIVGLPGDTIQGKNNHVYIDGKRLAEPYLPADTEIDNFGPLTVRSHHYFMMGDNRAGSNDSRRHSAVDERHFVGKVFMTVWPADRLSVPFWIFAIVVGGIGILVLTWVLTGRHQDVQQE